MNITHGGRFHHYHEIVYNQKRHGTFSLGNRIVTFERRFNVPKQLSPEFLLVDLVNELDQLAEDQDAVLSRVREKAKEMDPRKLLRAVSLYGKYSTRKRFREISRDGCCQTSLDVIK
jgi:hypothetical protein